MNIMVDASLSHLNQWIIDCVEKCQDAIFIEGQGDVCLQWKNSLI
jgi:hypothetical protein